MDSPKSDLVSHQNLRSLFLNLHDDTGVGGNTLHSSLALHSAVDKRVFALTGHSSAASFPTGPVMAEPFISPLALTI
jgi:hypothetical protein